MSDIPVFIICIWLLLLSFAVFGLYVYVKSTEPQAYVTSTKVNLIEPVQKLRREIIAQDHIEPFDECNGFMAFGPGVYIFRDNGQEKKVTLKRGESQMIEDFKSVRAE